MNTVNNESWYNQGAHPRHRSYMQAMYDAYIAFEVVPFIYDHCRTHGVAISTSGSSFGAYHAANTLFKHPTRVRRCLALSGVYDLRSFMDGHFDDNFYFGPDNPEFRDGLAAVLDPSRPIANAYLPVAPSSSA